MSENVLLLFKKLNDLNEARNPYFFSEIDNCRTFVWHENVDF